MGVTLKVGSGYGLDMSNYDFDFSDLPDATITTHNSTTIAGYVDGAKVVIRGSGFTYGEYGPTGGEVHSISETYGGATVVSATGLKLSVKSIVKVVESGSIVSAKALVKSALSGADKLSGGNYEDVLFGYDGRDILVGNRGADKLDGGNGDDNLTGGIGADRLFGGLGKDTFVFASANDSNDRLGIDTIFDFSRVSGDRIDLTRIDADATVSGNQAFTYIGSKAFSGTSGELRVEKLASDTYVYGDTNGDGAADFKVHLDDAVILTKGYFVL
jgi:Ca2+-binding RTX toxin-like protein